MPDAALLTVAGLDRRFGGVVILAGVSLRVAAGRALALVGPNGAGKTTLLRCIVGADRPDAGEIIFDGRPMSETDPRVRAAVAAVLDDVEFFGDLSVGEHLELLAYAHGAAPSDNVERVIADLDLGAVRDQLPPTLSSGQRRRFALASCFVRPRRLLVLDEPEQRLDVAGRRWLIERLLAEKLAGTAIVFASHDADIVDAIADEQLVLDR